MKGVRHMNLSNISKQLSYLLRHSTEPQYINLNGGWADTETIIEVLKKTYTNIDMDIIEQIVDSDAKCRYSFNNSHSKIRANQGHSIPGVIIEMDSPDPPELLYHGTATRFLSSITEQGLKPMSRRFVHISPDLETAIKVGKRHGKPVVLVIRAQKFVEDGNKLYLSQNGVWQAEYVAPEYFTVKYIN